MQREYPQNPRFHFAWIVLCQIQADKLPAGDRMGQSLKMLANRSLKAVVENTKGKKASIRKLTSSTDLRLLYQVYSRQGLLEDLLEILDDPDIGINSVVGKNDVEFVLIKMNILSELHRWPELRQFCLGGLGQLCQHYEAARMVTVDQPSELAWAVAWQPWKTALNATIEDSSLGSAEDVLKLSDRYLALDPQHRNAGNALLLYRYLFDKSQLLEACKTFFEAHASRVSCSDDLRQVVEGLRSEQRVSRQPFEYLVELA
jgi:hypothetical protein